ncbi:MAG TPA: hypothetical protein VFT72_20155 [Opitutaceae bacterium]|nr:hypothetical protein [Opitutaceae bacterium]
MATTRPKTPSFRFPGRALAASAVALCCLGTRAEAFYAPIPAVEQGKPLTVYLAAGAYYDTNVFGGETNRIESMVYQFSPALAFNAGVRKQTFASLNYRLSLDYIPNRPGTKLLDSHEIVGRLAHTFSPETEIDLSNSYQISKNPESLLPGLGVVAGDQSFRRNQADGRFTTALSRRTGVLLKARATTYAYENDAIAQDLNRTEILTGASAEYTLLPNWKANGEYRYQHIQYTTGGNFKDKDSHFLLGGTDYALNDRTALSARLGVENRQRRGEGNSTVPYVELGAKRDYAKGSFVSLGYGHSYEETSSVDLFTDMIVNRFFVNWQHVLTPKMIASASVNWEPSTLRGRPGISPDRDETNTRIGLALLYRPVENWSLSSTIDLDHIRSEQPGRSLERQRYGVSAKYAF